MDPQLQAANGAAAAAYQESQAWRRALTKTKFKTGSGYERDVVLQLRHLASGLRDDTSMALSIEDDGGIGR